MDIVMERAAAVAAVRAACRVCDDVQKRLVSSDALEKSDRSPVTVADFASQAVISAHLERCCPEIPLVAEEDSADLRSGHRGEILRSVVRAAGDGLGRPVPEEEILGLIDRGGADPNPGDLFWTLDPIDGTKGFLRGQQYAVALALVQGGQVLLGILGCPRVEIGDTTGVLLVASRGEGTEIVPLEEGGEPLEVAPTSLSRPSEARLCESVEKAHSSHDTAAVVARTLGITTPSLRVDSQVKYAMVAMGEASIYLRLPTREDYREKIWDHAAGSVVVTEAGGKVTDMDGKPLELTHGRLLAANRGIVATNGRIHDAVLQAVAEATERSA